MHKKIGFILAAAIATVPVGQAAKAAEACTVFSSERALVAKDDSLQVLVNVGKEVVKIDTTRNSLCFDFTGNDTEKVVDLPNVGKRLYKETVITPPEMCVDVSDTTLPPQHMTVHYKEGSPDTRELTRDNLKRFYDDMVAACREQYGLK